MTSKWEQFRQWLDSDGYIHIKKNPAIDQSENNPMYEGLLAASGHPVFGMFNRIHDIKSGLFRANAHREWGSHFSHDNMTGMYCTYKSKYSQYMVDTLPVMRWNNRWWLHPKDISFYFWAKNPRLGLPFLWIASLCMIISCYQEYKVRNGNKILKTDGKLLAWMRCKSFGMHRTLKICTWLIERNPKFGSWNNVAKIYFREEGHPLRDLVK